MKVQPHELDQNPPGSQNFADMMAFKYTVAHINIADLMMRDVGDALGPATTQRYKR